ncbi:MAG: V-type ATPase subunit [Promethearchaeia archaeon]
MGFFKNLIMKEQDLKSIKKINQIEELLEYIKVFYPNLNVNQNRIFNFENALYNNYISLIGRILSYSPENMVMFLNDILVKFEIRNIKRIILNTILGKSKDTKRKQINYKAEVLLHHEEFFNKLLKLNTLDEILFHMEDTTYYKIIKEGLIYFRKNNEIFILEAFLDRKFYDNLIQNTEYFSKKERDIIIPYINLLIEIYNLKIIFRSIRNGLDIELIKQLTIERFLILNSKDLGELISSEDQMGFKNLLSKVLRQNKELAPYFPEKNFIYDSLLKNVFQIYKNYYFNSLDVAIDDFDARTILGIIELIMKKEFEINHAIMPSIIRILHKKFRILKNN